MKFKLSTCSNLSFYAFIGILSLRTKYLIQKIHDLFLVRRRNVWEDVKFEIRKCSSEDLNSMIKVQFVGEPAVNEGGPRNEFFSLLHSEVSKSCMFVGEDNRKSFNHDILALQQRSFYTYGQLCYVGILKSSASPCSLSPSIVDNILRSEIDLVKSICISDIPNQKVSINFNGRSTCLRQRSFF